MSDVKTVRLSQKTIQTLKDGQEIQIATFGADYVTLYPDTDDN